jgi:hypothetical protein
VQLHGTPTEVLCTHSYIEAQCMCWSIQDVWMALECLECLHLAWGFEQGQAPFTVMAEQHYQRRHEAHSGMRGGMGAMGQSNLTILQNDAALGVR